ncbi:Acetolactate synthase large subunit [Moorella thermoacetica]|uniref:Acetolactate synthase n=1 Tax=Neomoorella thermoacetica TaxID=1525 RepID=A0AAC9HJZ5_NEOTH|nr:biosynthetic-type acetolactate synthase large subunit [Moorella thermoacetica]AOQ25224.1 Acetolactate synthase large subunit [Moorella thermoacetica]TYL11841.1 Acetolactate synthase large subunit [Moorella thermoacetica]
MLFTIGDRAEGKKLTGAEIIVQALQAEGVDTVFGIPGGSVLPLYHELAVASIRHILTRHEQAAAHAADGYARASGKPGVCIATSGPGATNLVTGIANAYMDSIPLVAITGQVSVPMIGHDSFQEADITGITLPITKANYLVKNVHDLAATIHEAFYIATTGRPGPVLIDIPKDITTQRALFRYPPRLHLPGYRCKVQPHALQVAQAAAAIGAAEKPLLFIGGGVITSEAHEEVRQLAEGQDIPVVMSMMGKGGFPETHPLFVGMVGMHGTAAANYAMCETDLIIGVGVRFDDRVTGKVEAFAPKAKIIHIDIDAAEIGKVVQAHIPIVSDARQGLAAILEKLPGKADHQAWRQQIRRWQEENPLRYEKSGLKPQYVLEELYNLTKGQAIICTDVGQHQMWAVQYYPLSRPRAFLSSCGLGTMGFGVPAAMGAAVARPGEPIVVITGDGSFQMNIQELATISHYQLPLKIIIMNNGYLGMVRQWQEFFFNRRYAYSEMLGNPDFVKVAEAYRIPGRLVNESREVVPALEEALAAKGPFLVDVRIDREENVFPMVPPGGTLNKMVTGGKGA